jgi:hypothetical protein
MGFSTVDLNYGCVPTEPSPLECGSSHASNIFSQNQLLGNLCVLVEQLLWQNAALCRYLFRLPGDGLWKPSTNTFAKTPSFLKPYFLALRPIPHL